MNNRLKLATTTLLATAVLSSPSLWAQETFSDDSGPFISGSYGGYAAQGGEFEDENDLFGVSAGYQFNEFFAVEVDYIDFGNFGEDDVSGDLQGFALGLRGRLPVTDVFGVYAKAGVFASALDIEAFEHDETYDDINPFVGAGIDFRISEPLSVFAEYDRYNVDIDADDFNGQINNDGPDFDTARLGLRFAF